MASQTKSLACTDCHQEKGKLDFRPDGDVVFRFTTACGHVQGLGLKRTLEAVLKRDPDWLKKFLDVKEKSVVGSAR